MTYSRNWKNTAPAGSLPASRLDTTIQQFRQDVVSRFESFFDDFDTDPLTRKVSLSTEKLPVKVDLVNHKYTLGGGNTTPLMVLASSGWYVYAPTSGQSSLFFPIVLVAGIVLSTIDIKGYVVNSAGASVTVRLNKIANVTTPTVTTLTSVAYAGSGYTGWFDDSIAVGETISAGHSYLLRVDLVDSGISTSARFAGFTLNG